MRRAGSMRARPASDSSFSCAHLQSEGFGAQPHRGAVGDLPGELSAGRIDVVAASLANGDHEPALHELVPEALDGRGRRAAILRSGKWIERNQIELGWLVAQQLRQFA